VSLLDHEDDIAKMYFVEGHSYQEIADVHGTSREAVRQFLNRRFPDRVDGRTFRKEFRSAERERMEAEELESRNVEAPSCVVCYKPVTRKTGGRGANRTHSSECSKLWAKARFLLDDNLRRRQRLSMAKSILKYRDNHPPSAISWANKVVSGGLINARTYVRKDSETRRAYDEVMRIRAEGKVHGHQQV